MTLVGAILGAMAVIFALPVAILMAEILCALMISQSRSPVQMRRPAGLRVAVLVPAHDEEEGVAATVSGIRKQLGPLDRLVVVADNCIDATAERALAAGVETIVRLDPLRRGKGYALDFGVRHLESDPPDVLVIIDADCRLGPGTIDALLACVAQHRKSAQAFNGVVMPQNADSTHRLANFAWILKTHVRPAGLKALGLPTQFMGTGMAIPWMAIRNINLATGNIVEDVKMGLDLAAAGFAPRYCPEARVESDFPVTERGYAIQRQRWEAGSVATILKIAPFMFLRGLAGLNVSLMTMAADLMVPPVMMLLVGLLFGLAATVIFALIGDSIFPAIIFCGSLLVLIVVLTSAWFRFGRDALRPRDFLALPGMLLWKFRLYVAIWRGRGTGWVRTDRK